MPRHLTPDATRGAGHQHSLAMEEIVAEVESEVVAVKTPTVEEEEGEEEKGEELAAERVEEAGSDDVEEEEETRAEDK